MRRSLILSRTILSTLAALSIACSSSGGDDDDDDDDDVIDVPDASPEYETLTLGEWEMPAGEEGYYCVRTTIEEDIYIKEFKPIAPIGTHHTALSIDMSSGADGTFPCGASDTGFRLLFGSGIGTEPFELPDGVAFKLEAGTRIMLNLHLYNVSDDPITGASGIEVKLASPNEVEHEAETVYAMNFDLEVPPGDSTHRSRCTINDDTTVFGVFPHMHRYGRHMTGSVIYDGQDSEQVFFDEPFDFEDQANHLLPSPVALTAGDEIHVACGFSNDTANTVGFGDSSDDEMCVLGLYRYPARDGFGLCFD